MSECIKCGSITLFKGADGRTIYNGSGAPTLTTANTEDFYIDTTAWEIYGPYTGTSWGSGTSLVGATGAQGVYGGWSSEWLFSNNTGSGTGGTQFRFDNATLASVGTLYINDSNADSTDVSAFVGAWDNSENFGLVRVSKKTNPNVFWMGVITEVIDLGSEHAVSATHVASNGTFSDGDAFVLSYVQTGNLGAYGGYSSEWTFSNNTGSGSGSGELRFNNATLASVTGMYVNNTNADSTDLTAVLDSFDNNSNFGIIRISSKTDSNIFWMGQVTAEVDSGSEHNVTITHVASNGTFVNGSAVILSFTNNGANNKYSLYAGLMNQAGISAPTVTELENDIGAIVWTYAAVGTYLGTLAGAFDTTKTLCLMSASNFAANPGSIVTITCINSNDIRIKTYDATGTLADDLLDGAVGLEIKRYL